MNTQHISDMTMDKIKAAFSPELYEVLFKEGHWGDSLSVMVKRKSDNRRHAYILTGGNESSEGYNPDVRRGLFDNMKSDELQKRLDAGIELMLRDFSQ